MTGTRIVVLLDAPDRPGIVGIVGTALARSGTNIDELDAHHDQVTERFHGRFEVSLSDPSPDALDVVARQVESTTGGHVSITDVSRPVPTALCVTREPHCAADLLARADAGELGVDIRVLIGTDSVLAPLADRYGVPFELIDYDRSETADRRFLDAVGSSELIVLARFMRILSGRVVASRIGQIINIHHGFLPAFPGASPYRQAYERGVKLIGATAHYVTEGLDEGPIIAQDTRPVTHRDDIDDLIAKGRDLERVVLARAVAAHVDRRTVICGNRVLVH